MLSIKPSMSSAFARGHSLLLLLKPMERPTIVVEGNPALKARSIGRIQCAADIRRTMQVRRLR